MVIILLGSFGWGGVGGDASRVHIEVDPSFGFNRFLPDIKTLIVLAA